MTRLHLYLPVDRLLERLGERLGEHGHFHVSVILNCPHDGRGVINIHFAVGGWG